ncbi:MAG: hypothetical protein J5477_05890 [Schwartzia sp.]|nr:hypothetical protein [Schwartzia sp. (in: firmicutes)]
MQKLGKIGLAVVFAIGAALGGAAEAATTEEARQLDLLSAQEEIWKGAMSIEEAIAQGGEFAVTDLDHNGRLELLFTTTVGAEEFIENWGYEVNETEDGVSLLTALNGSDGTDIGRSPVTMYFACQTGARYYIFETVHGVPSMEGGWAREGRLSGLRLDHGKIRQELLGGFFEAHEKRELPPISTIYRDSDYNKIDAEAYANLASKRYPYHHHFEVKIGWTRIIELADAMDSQEKVRAVFAKSWEKFHEEEIGDDPHT